MRVLLAQKPKRSQIPNHIQPPSQPNPCTLSQLNMEQGIRSLSFLITSCLWSGLKMKNAHYRAEACRAMLSSKHICGTQGTYWSRAAGWDSGAVWGATLEIPGASPAPALLQCISKELGDGEVQDEAQQPCREQWVQMLFASMSLQQAPGWWIRTDLPPFWRAPLTSHPNRAVWQKPGTPVFMIYFNQICCLWKEAIASLHHRHKYYANADFMSCSSPAPLIHFRLGRMTSVIIKWDEGNTERQLVILFLLKKMMEKICVSHQRAVGERLLPLGALWWEDSTSSCTQEVKELKTEFNKQPLFSTKHVEIFWYLTLTFSDIFTYCVAAFLWL